MAETLFSLGSQFVSDFISLDTNPDPSTKIELALEMTDNGNVRLKNYANLSSMFGKYFYRSSMNNTMKEELQDVVQSILKIFTIKENDIWVDCASNDGTLLSFVPNELIKIGIDPVEGDIKADAEKHANLIVQDYFSAEAYKSTPYKNNKVKIFTSIAVFYDLTDPVSFIKSVDEILDNDGLWCLQLSHTPLMIEQLAFDNILFEHAYYYSLFNLKALLENNGFQVVDCQLNTVNGGSFRVMCMKQNANIKLFGTQPHRDVCNFRINSLLEYEKKLELDNPKTWHKFFDRIVERKEEIMSYLKAEKAAGSKIWGYAASTKANTLLQYFGIDNTILDGIADKNPAKWGLKTIGSNIEVHSEQIMRDARPDILLILSWHFIFEFKNRELDLLKEGCKFVVPMPKFEITGA